MLLYHGSTSIVNKPEIKKGENFLDFGVGFYTTTSFEQAQRWAKVKMKRNNAEVGYVSIFELDINKAFSEYKIIKFESADEKWLKFVVNNRKGINYNGDTDIHIGPVADDNVYKSIRLFETGAYDEEYTIKQLKTEVLHDQWAFHNESVLKDLCFVKATVIK